MRQTGTTKFEFEFLVRAHHVGITHNPRDTRVSSITVQQEIHTGSLSGIQQSKLRATGHDDEHTKGCPKKESTLNPRSHSKPPEPIVTDPATPRTPGVRILQAFVFWANYFDPTIYPGYRFGGLLTSGGIIRSNVSEHFLWDNRFKAHRSWISWLFIGFIFYKHIFQQICIVGCVWIFERSFGGCSLVRLLPKHASRTVPMVRDGDRRTFSLASLLYLASLSNWPSTLNAGTTPALLVRCTLTTGSFSIASHRRRGKTTYARRIR